MQSKVGVQSTDTLLDLRLNGKIMKIGFCSTDADPVTGASNIFEMCFFTDDPMEQLVFHFSSLAPKDKKTGSILHVDKLSNLELFKVIQGLKNSMKDSVAVSVLIKGPKGAIFLENLATTNVSLLVNKKDQNHPEKFELDSYISMYKEKNKSALKCVLWV